MKKLLALVGTIVLLITTAKGSTGPVDYIINIEDAVYYGSRSGKLTKKEVRVLNSELTKYEKTLWKYEKNGKLSKRERRKLKRIQHDLNNKLNVALRNQERVVKVRQKTKTKARKRNRNQGPICRYP